MNVELFSRSNQSAFQHAQIALVMIARLRFMCALDVKRGKARLTESLGRQSFETKKERRRKKMVSLFLIAFLGLIPLLFSVAVSRPHLGVL